MRYNNCREQRAAERLEKATNDRWPAAPENRVFRMAEAMLVGYA
jgi:hypothetical protein